MGVREKERIHEMNSLQRLNILKLVLNSRKHLSNLIELNQHLTEDSRFTI